jgi:hypothetical protein
MPPVEASMPRELRIQEWKWNPRSVMQVLFQVGEQGLPVFGNLVFTVVVVRTETGVQQKYVNGRVSNIAKEWQRQEPEMKASIAGRAEVRGRGGLTPTLIRDHSTRTPP